MVTTFYLESAQDVNNSILDVIKSKYQSKPISIKIEDDFVSDDLTDEFKKELDLRLSEDDSDYLTASESVALLKEKYGV
ncbi:MAG: hypothetical protein EAZ53_03805 [Bacteroidetes bacterium]|nr:MAG: hypothetical protein EAZ53_03805 [Bacteroidota bacterium]